MSNFFSSHALPKSFGYSYEVICRVARMAE
jgi:hypothetical protein